MSKLVKKERLTPFGKWLSTKMVEYDVTCDELAKAMHITRQTVVNHKIEKVNVPYMAVCAYCHVFGGEDDPDEIWELLKKD